MPNTIKIALVNGDAPTTHVKAGDQVQWTATVLSYVFPPAIFAGSQCNGCISVPANGTAVPSNACHVTGQPGSYLYTSGLGNCPTECPDDEDLGTSNDTIVVDL